ncbi:MAG TPA: LPS export ABC transporter ATP-binding protein [Gammaproteobacteria bacterium]|jgi:lipopolysaccharide export system ATP-binding protein|nr:LPS export ABC transporter ATP-binding protein [Gammaproteobacteria bacterium]HIK72557.1 LPS export ABC transporter ATP-binding protein [Gammaproteobacteria bacterium]
MKLVARNLRKEYSGKTAVDRISIEVSSGETVGLLGPNGAGKTTFFYMIVGLLGADSGKISIDSKDMTNMGISSRSKAGLSYLPQEPSIFRRLTVKENILAALEQRPDLNKDDRSRKLKELLNDFSLHEFSETKGIKLSGGERRRVEIARALASNPKFLLLDEPFAGIDPIAVSDLKSTIKSLNDSGYGILISDHNVRDTMQICHKVLIMSEGKIVAEGSPDEISNNEKVKEVYLGKDFSS